MFLSGCVGAVVAGIVVAGGRDEEVVCLVGRSMYNIFKHTCIVNIYIPYIYCIFMYRYAD